MNTEEQTPKADCAESLSIDGLGVNWHNPECEGQCFACLIEATVLESYGKQGLEFLQRKLGAGDTARELYNELVMAVGQKHRDESRHDTALRDVADAVCKQFAAAGIAPVIGSPNPSEDLHARAVIALGGKVEREHIASAACWCQPDTNYVDPVTGAVVYVHRQVQ